MEKWSDADMDKFLDAYQEHELLWNPNIELYRNSDARKNALSKIIEYMNKPNLTENDLKTKIKNIRTTYKRELTRVLKAKKSGARVDDLYIPVLRWFKKADVFLRSITQARESKTNMEPSTQSQINEDSSSTGIVIESFVEEESSEPFENVSGIPNEVIASTSAGTPTATPKNRNQLGSLSRGGISKRKATGDFPTGSGFGNALDRLEKISESVNLPVEDEFDLFGKHIACQLRKLPLHRALHIQQNFQRILMDERIASYNSFDPMGSSSRVSSNERPSDILGAAMECLKDLDDEF